MDALTMVRQEHRRLEDLLERCERLDRDGGWDRRALRRFQAAVRHHVDQEESILYTIFRERARQAGVDLAPLDRAVEQHRLIDRLATELTDAPDGDARGAKLTVLAERVRTHLDDEDAVLLTAIEDLLDDDTLLELGRRMEQRDRVIQARRELAATVVPGGARSRRLAAAALGGLAALGSALLALLARRRRPPRSRAKGWRRRRAR
jgi:hemerythrin-like domain-containing protein